MQLNHEENVSKLIGGKMEELVEKAKNGNKEAYAELITNVKKDLYKAARCKIDEPEDIEDIIQDTTIIAYTKIKQLRDNKLFKAWIIKILNNECKKFYINRKRDEEINDKYINNREESDSNKIEEKLEFDNMIKDLSDIDKEIMKLYYEDNLSTEQISKLLGINPNTIKSKISRSKQKIKFTYKKILMTALLFCIITTGVVFGKDIINYLIDILNLSTIGRNNDGILSAIESKEWIQNTGMEYIDLNDGYKIRIDYLLIDDINMYMVFDLICDEEQKQYDRMSIEDLIIKDENGNIICNETDVLGTTIAKLEGWKSIETNSNKNIKELKYMISEGYPKMEKLDITFSEVVIYKHESSEKENKVINQNEINISIDIDEKFINRNVIEYVQEEVDDEYNIQKSIITDTGFYAIIETTESNIDFELKVNNKKYKCTYRFLNMEKHSAEMKYYHLILADIEQSDVNTQLVLKSETKNIILNKK